MTSPDRKARNDLFSRQPSRYREVGDGPFGCVTVNPDGSVVVRRFRSQAAAVLAMMRGSSGGATGTGEPAPASPRPLDDPDAA